MSGGAPPPTGSAPTEESPDVEAQTAPHTLHVSIALSTIIASIWAGIWGFDWAATHLSAFGLWLAIVIGLFVGSVLTAYVSHEAFEIMREAIRLSRATSHAKVDLAERMLRAPRPPPTQHWWSSSERKEK